MKLETTFFEGPARILRGETVMDTVKDITRHPGQEDSFMVLNIGDVVQKIKNWRLKLPRVKPFYAVKCNDNKIILKTLSALGTGFDCASKAEIKKVMEMGVSPSRIIFAHPCKPSSHIRQANAFGVNTMTFDNENELFKVKSIMPHARLVLRIRCDAAVAQCPLGMKFGADREMVSPLLSVAKDLGLNVIGVSFHVGSGCQEPEVFLRAIGMAREAFDEAIALGFDPYLLDIGGGFPGTSGSSLDEIAEYVNTALEEHFPDESVKVIAEPGRYVVASACTLVTQVISKRRVGGDVSQVDDPSFMYYINDGVYGSFNCTLYDHQEVLPLALKNEDLGEVEEEDESRQYSCSIWGPTCDSMDKVISDAKLPELEIGDWIVWEDMGAYTIAAAGTFNGFPVPLVHVVVPFHTWVSLEGYLADDLLSNVPDDLKGVDAVDSASTLPQNYLAVPNVPSFGSHYDKDHDCVLDHMNTSFSRLNVVEI